MGCDIHAYTEVRRGGGTWEEDGPAWPNPYPDMPEYESHMWDFRYYDAFSCLADCRRREDVKPLAPNRGLPPDMSEGVRRVVSQWRMDAHSHSWYLLSELLTFNYDTPCCNRRTDEPGNPEVMLTYRQIMENDVLRDVETLRAWAQSQDIDPEDVRIVFFFDN